VAGRVNAAHALLVGDLAMPVAVAQRITRSAPPSISHWTHRDGSHMRVRIRFLMMLHVVRGTRETKRLDERGVLGKEPT
jgi:hypothetical protein